MAGLVPKKPTASPMPAASSTSGGVAPNVAPPGMSPAAGGAKPPMPGAPQTGTGSGPKSPFQTAPGKPPPVQQTAKIPESQFHSGSSVPDIDLSPLDMPDTHVTPEFALEHASRVLLDLAEHQDDPVWCQQHIVLSQQWLSMAELLLNHAVQGKQIEGDAHIKQQQLNQQEDLHRQTLAQNDQQHFQGMKQSEDQHKQKLTHNDKLLTQNTKHAAAKNQMDMQVTKQKAQVDLQSTKQHAQLSIADKKAQIQQRKTAQAQKAKQTAAKPKPSSSSK